MQHLRPLLSLAATWLAAPCLAVRLASPSGAPRFAAQTTLRRFRGGVASAAAPPDSLTGLREAIAQCGVHGYVVPSGDAHLSEYVHPAYDRRAFISRFTGSAGTALITEDQALLWTDGVRSTPARSLSAAHSAGRPPLSAARSPARRGAQPAERDPLSATR
jgi:hypothetical protein